MDEERFDKPIDGLMTVTEFCNFARCCRNTFYKELREGRLAAKQHGRKVFILRSEAERWVRDMPPASVAVPKTVRGGGAAANPFVGAAA
jgi:excisionase family DNA binding protein